LRPVKKLRAGCHIVPEHKVAVERKREVEASFFKTGTFHLVFRFLLENRTTWEDISKCKRWIL
jgi:hypothetical protein